MLIRKFFFSKTREVSYWWAKCKTHKQQQKNPKPFMTSTCSFKLNCFIVKSQFNLSFSRLTKEQYHQLFLSFQVFLHKRQVAPPWGVAPPVEHFGWGGGGWIWESDSFSLFVRLSRACVCVPSLRNVSSVPVTVTASRAAWWPTAPRRRASTPSTSRGNAAPSARTVRRSPLRKHTHEVNLRGHVVLVLNYW